jgi:[ribosomal protein S5]-alanine N-acetyltransferase
MQFPTLKTSRLTLRPFRLADAPRLQQLAGAREVALNTLLIPHPYPDGAAEEWIASHAVKFDEGTINLAIDDGELCGAIGLVVDREHDRAEIGYWLGVPYWGRGYATEAVVEVIRYGFEELHLNRIFAAHFTRNPASGVVLRKAGMKFEGTLRQNYKKWGEYLDSEMYSILGQR